MRFRQRDAGFALALHELATNAAKFGALFFASRRAGCDPLVGRGAAARTPRFSFSWQESGGPRVTPPERNGFGTTLLKSALGDATPRPLSTHRKALISLSKVPYPLSRQKWGLTKTRSR